MVWRRSEDDFAAMTFTAESPEASRSGGSLIAIFWLAFLFPYRPADGTSVNAATLYVARRNPALTRHAECQKVKGSRLRVKNRCQRSTIRTIKCNDIYDRVLKNRIRDLQTHRFIKPQSPNSFMAHLSFPQMATVLPPVILPTGGTRTALRAAAPISLPEQLALSLGREIVAGRYVEGQRLIETELADHFAVSRGPVRDALRLLERRRCITLEPRKGAYVRTISLDAIADIFNVRSALFATAARFTAQLCAGQQLLALTQHVQAVQMLANDPDTAADQFLNAVVQMRQVMVMGSGSDLIAELLSDLDQHTVWSSQWAMPDHFQTRETRQRDSRHVMIAFEAIQLGDGVMADRSVRRMIEYNRDTVIGALASTRNERVDPARMLSTCG